MYHCSYSSIPNTMETHGTKRPQEPEPKYDQPKVSQGAKAAGTRVEVVVDGKERCLGSPKRQLGRDQEAYLR